MLNLNKNEINRYKLVHDIAKLAKELEDESRNPSSDKQNNLYKEVNKAKKKRNYVLEAFEKIQEDDVDAE